MEDDDPGMMASLVAMLRLLAGWSCVALGLLDLAMGWADGRYLLFHLVLVLGGVLLLAWHRTGRALRPLALAAGGGVTVAGLVISAVPQVTACCFTGYAVRHGFPFAFLARDPGDWRFSAWHLVADLVFWGLIGAGVTMAVPEPRRVPILINSTHSEPRAADVPTPLDENVGGSP